MSGDCVVVYVRWPDHRRTLIDKSVRRPVKQCLTIHVIVRRQAVNVRNVKRTHTATVPNGLNTSRFKCQRLRRYDLAGTDAERQLKPPLGWQQYASARQLMNIRRVLDKTIIVFVY
jgi:hypothetical protein